MLKFKVFKTRNCIKLVEWDSDSEKGRLRDHFTKKSKDGDFLSPSVIINKTDKL